MTKGTQDERTRAVKFPKQDEPECRKIFPDTLHENGFRGAFDSFGAYWVDSTHCTCPTEAKVRLL